MDAGTKQRQAGRVALITGASSGLGRAEAVRLSTEGATVVLVDIADLAVTSGLIESHGSEVLAVKCDIGSEADVRELVAVVEAKYGRCDILVNNAAVHAPRPNVNVVDLPDAVWNETVRVNLGGMFLLSRSFAPKMCERRWGRIVNIASNTVGQVMPGMSAYIATKMGVVGFTRALATDLGESGVTVNAVLPGLTRTEHSEMGRQPGEYEARAGRQAIPRVGAPEDIANAVAFFASDDASFMTGQSLIVDGGFIRN